MKALIIAAMISVPLSLTVIAQTPVPPKNPGTNPSPVNAVPGNVMGRVAVLYTDQFWHGIGEFKVTLDGLDNELEPKRKEIATLEEEIKALKKSFQTGNATATPKLRLQLEEEVAEKEKIFKRKTEDYNHLGEKRLAEVSRPVSEKIRRFIESYCRQNGIILCIEGNAATQAGFLLWSAQAIDITSDFMAQYNKAYPVTSKPLPESKKN
jgi:Skp family chaperone for outer membrane proteins